MDRHTIEPREGWISTIQQQGLIYYETVTEDGEKYSYWTEDAHYSLTITEVYEMEAAVRLLMEMLVEAGDHIIDNKLWDKMGIPGWAVPLIEASWHAEPPMLYGRFDFAKTPDGLKMLEYNADTPTALVESAVTQWYWAKDQYGEAADQWNSIHEALVTRWKEMHQAKRLPGEYLHMFHCSEENSGEDFMTVGYLSDTAREAGVDNIIIESMNSIGWDDEDGTFKDLAGNPIRTAFKLYPWEWMVHEDYMDHMAATMDTGATVTEPRIIWIEPIWKMLWSNKGILPVLWELNPGHELLVPAFFATDPEADVLRAAPEGYVEKPLLAREGADSLVKTGDGVIEEGPQQGYGEEGHVVQQYVKLDSGDWGYNPVLGVWTVDMEPVGLGIRESPNLITNNMSRFVPHVLVED